VQDILKKNKNFKNLLFLVNISISQLFKILFGTKKSFRIWYPRDPSKSLPISLIKNHVGDLKIALNLINICVDMEQ
jgi:hypothetical protein